MRSQWYDHIMKIGGYKARNFIDVIICRPVGLVLALLFAVTLLLCEQAQAQNDRLIVPWKRVGPVELGMTAADLFRILGDPTQTIREPPDRDVTVYEWNNDLSVYVKKDGSYVTQICARSLVYATAEGVHPGSTELSVTALLGEPRNLKVYRGWWKLSYANLYWPGLMISMPLTGFDPNHVVWAVCVNQFS
jgi:hypothetical protein